MQEGQNEAASKLPNDLWGQRSQKLLPARKDRNCEES